MASKRSDTVPMHNEFEKDEDSPDSCDNICRCLGGAFIFLFVTYSISIIPFSSIFALLGTLWMLFDTWVLGTIDTLTVKFWSLVYYVVRLPFLLIAWPFTAIWNICHGMPPNSGFFGKNSSTLVFNPVVEISGLLERYSAVEALTGDFENGRLEGIDMSSPTHWQYKFYSQRKATCGSGLRARTHLTTTTLRLCSLILVRR